MQRRINSDTKRRLKSYIKIRKPPIADSKGRAYGISINAVPVFDNPGLPGKPKC
jgi:hypothetical protein